MTQTIIYQMTFNKLLKLLKLSFNWPTMSFINEINLNYHFSFLFYEIVEISKILNERSFSASDHARISKMRGAADNIALSPM